MTCNCRSSGAAIRLLLLLRLAPRLDHFPQRHILHKLPPIAHCSEYQYITAQRSTAQHSTVEQPGSFRDRCANRNSVTSLAQLSHLNDQ
jgi:hypothetical protein